MRNWGVGLILLSMIKYIAGNVFLLLSLKLLSPIDPSSSLQVNMGQCKPFVMGQPSSYLKTLIWSLPRLLFCGPISFNSFSFNMSVSKLFFILVA